MQLSSARDDAGRPARLVDVGDVPFELGAGAANARRADEMLAQIVGQSVMPLVIGGDDSIPPIVARALGPRDVRRRHDRRAPGLPR